MIGPIFFVVCFASIAFAQPSYVVMSAAFPSTNASCVGTVSLGSPPFVVGSPSCVPLSQFTGNTSHSSASVQIAFVPDGASATLFFFPTSATCSSLASSSVAANAFGGCVSLLGPSGAQFDVVLTWGPFSQYQISLTTTRYPSSSNGTCLTVPTVASSITTPPSDNGACLTLSSIFNTSLTGSMIGVFTEPGFFTGLVWPSSNTCTGGSPTTLLRFQCAGACVSLGSGISDAAFSWIASQAGRLYTLLPVVYSSSNGTCSIGPTTAIPIYNIPSPGCVSLASVTGDVMVTSSLQMAVSPDYSTLNTVFFPSSSSCKGLSQSTAS